MRLSNGGTSTGNLGIGTTSAPAYKLDVNGDINMYSNKVLRISSKPVLSNIGIGNILVGDDAGKSNAGSYGTFLGYHAGYGSNSGDGNTFLGYYSGNTNIGGAGNTFVGIYAGNINTTGNSNTFLGASTNFFTGTSGDRNTFLGFNAYGSSTTGTLTSSSAIGTLTQVTASNNIILGRCTTLTELAIRPDHVGIGVTETDPNVKLHVNANTFPYAAVFIGGNVGIDAIHPAHKLEVNGEANVSATLFANAVQSTTSVTGNSETIYGDIELGGNLIPRNNSGGGGCTGCPTQNLGNGSHRWDEIYCVNATINTSDINLKTNIEPLKYGINELMKLSTITFNWKAHDNGTRIGLSAQELKGVIPEVVVEDSGRLGVRYTELIPILINSIKEQQNTIESLQQQLNTLSGNNSQNLINQNSGSSSSSTNGSSTKNNVNSLGGDISVLYQNQPNPFKDNTTIEYYLIPNTQKASLLIFDMNGALLKTVQITQFGKGTVQINGGDLKPGMFFYSLIADNKEVDSKKMILLD